MQTEGEEKIGERILCQSDLPLTLQFSCREEWGKVT